MDNAQLLAAVLANPDVLWAVLTADVKVAGPWAGEGNRFRRAAGRQLPIASVMRLGYGPTFQAFADRDCTPAYPGMTREAAESWCDAQLLAAGWLLASEVEGG